MGSMPAQLRGLALPLLALLCPQPHPTAAEEPVWTLVFRQTTTEGKAVWQPMDDWRSYGSSDTDANYSVLDHLDELLGPDKLYHLKLLYPLSHKGQSNEWTQTQSPMKSEGKNAKIAGYTAIHCDWTNGPFIGLQLCSDAADDKSTLLCSQNNRGNWWCARRQPSSGGVWGCLLPQLPAGVAQVRDRCAQDVPEGPQQHPGPQVRRGSAG